MSLTAHFAQASDAGFIHSVDPRTARRQFTLSLGLVVALALVVGVAGSMMRGGVSQVASISAPVRLVVQAPAVVHVQQAVRTQIAPRG